MKGGSSVHVLRCCNNKNKKKNNNNKSSCDEKMLTERREIFRAHNERQGQSNGYKQKVCICLLLDAVKNSLFLFLIKIKKN